MNSSEKNGAFFLSQNPATLLLEDGTIFKGYALGAIGTTTGELCFNTSMVGYQEILTDPSYNRQIILMTYPQIGNYGINSNDIESRKIQASGLIIKDISYYPSNYQSEKPLDQYLIDNNIVGIYGIDTRSLTKHLRNNGAMNAIISSKIMDDKKLLEKLDATPSMEGLNLVENVTCSKSYQYEINSQNQFKVAAIDYGIKSNILKLLNEHNCNVTIFPANVTNDEINNFKPDGIFLSNGPGDPSAVDYAIKCIQSLIGMYPIFGICLGHQLLALALGAKTFKLKYGHRGSNHPVKNLSNNKIEITSQNHGFAVSKDNLPNDITVTHINLNDNTIAGISNVDMKAFSVQYHPESSPGPHDSEYLFQLFTKLMEDNAQKK